jgi:hypothetical protein
MPFPSFALGGGAHGAARPEPNDGGAGGGQCRRSRHGGAVWCDAVDPGVVELGGGGGTVVPGGVGAACRRGSWAVEPTVGGRERREGGEGADGGPVGG